MRPLEAKISQEGKILPGDILKVDHFLNHQIDVELFMQMGQDFYEHFKEKGITKILTLEVSGIAVAFAVAVYLKVPLVFAKKTASMTLSDDVYTGHVISYTKKKEYDIRVDKNLLIKEDKVLLIDDFLATGQALKGMFSLCEEAGCDIVGVGIAIEKTFQGGGNYFRELGYDVYSQAMIDKFEDGKVIFTER